MVYYFVTATALKPQEGEQHQWLWNGASLIKESRTFSQVSDAADLKGHKVAFTRYWKVPLQELDKIRRKVQEALEAEGAQVEIFHRDVRFDATLRIDV